MWCHCAWIALAASACGGGTEPPASTTVDCAPRHVALASSVAHMRTGARVAPATFPLPIVPGATAEVEEALPVSNDGSGWVIDGVPTTSALDTLRDHAVRLRLVAEVAPSRPFTGTIQLSLARTMPAADARALLDHMGEADFVHVHLIVAHSDDVPPSTAPTMPEWVRTSLTNPQPDRATVLATDFARASGPCTQLAALYETTHELTPGATFAAFLEELPATLRACPCEGVDLDAVSSILFEEHERRGPDVYELDFHLPTAEERAASPEAPAPIDVPLAANATVADLVAAIAALPEESRVVHFITAP
jgi:hypothetical protein